MMRERITVFSVLVLIMTWSVQVSNGCTNFLITKGASVDGSTMITYAADSHVLYGELYYQPAADHAPGSMRNIYEWDTGKFMGRIPEVAHTYNVIGNMNEFQLAIGETTYGGREELAKQEGAIMDYGSLIYVTLQRAKTAREAIKVMTDLVENFGYASSGESFSISDPEEVWILEMIGKGNGEKGAVWVALRVPDGYISGHANQARITTFPMNDPKNCIFSKDVVSFAREKGWFEGKNKDFSFSDVYAPVDFSGARFCDARVFAGFNKVASGMGQYTEYAKGVVKHGGENNFPVNRLPLWVKPDKKVSVKDVMEMMRDHYEGTELDMTKDIGAGPYTLPYRWRNMTWKVDSVAYCHERAISTQQTGFSFVAQSRNWLPAPIGGILWFGVDDTYSTCYVPMYCGITEIPECFRVGNGDMLTFSETSAFWTFNQVTNWAYMRYSDMIPYIRAKQADLEEKFIAYTPAVDQAAKTIYDSRGEAAARRFLSDYSVNQANGMTSEWKKLYQYLLVKYMDGNVKKEKDGKFLRNEWGVPAGPDHPGYPEWWYRVIVNATGDHFKMTGSSGH
ncbi:MAG: C69 family dipeptidase [Prolixibacteraceae bacterium]|nr:C69 family dipeptidase [Prolixibacteraceae bacterium]